VQRKSSAIRLSALLVALAASLARCGSSDSAESTNPKKDAGTEADAQTDESVPSDASDESDVVAEAADGGQVSDAAPLNPLPGVWTYYSVDGTQCLDGSPAGFGINTSPASQDLMIYLEGGGACFNDACDFTAFNIPFVPPLDGIFNRLNLLNPVRDWNMVYVPYCTGDIHGGDNDTTLAGQLRHFHGYTNIQKYLQTWVATFPNVKRVLVTGISAGGFGAGLNAQQVAEAFGPSRQYVLIDDSGPPLSNAAMPPCLQSIFRSVWGLDKTILAACGADCTHPDDFARDWIAHIAKTYPSAYAGVFSNTHDTVIRAFMGFGWGDGVYDNCSGTASSIPPDVYQQDLLDLRSQYTTRIATYYVGPTQALYGSGLWHTVLRSSTFYTTDVGGVLVAKWVSDVITGQVEHVGP
jgi:hypothetical protein